MIYLFYLLLFLMYGIVVWASSAFVISILRWLIDHNYLPWYKRITPMFILEGNKICQFPSQAQRKTNKTLKKERLTATQLMRLASSLSSDIWKGANSDILKKGQLYKTKTHLLGALKKAEKNGIIDIKGIRPKGKRPLIEALTFVSLSDFIKNLKFFTRRFYKVEFYYK